MNRTNLHDLVQMGSPQAVLDEVLTILHLMPHAFDETPVTSAFKTTVDLYEGRYPGYRSCNTRYHDLNHITYTFLAMARLIHGAVIEGESFTSREITLSLVAALLHDAGYIQESDDTEGTGSKYTTIHVKRSIAFFETYARQHGLSEDDIDAGRSMILCTDLGVDIRSIAFISNAVELLGKILGAADVMAQASDRIYLEKLLFLYHEFREGRVDGYSDEVDMLRKTLEFYDFIAQRLDRVLGGVDRFMLPHLETRWNIHDNLYHQAISNQMNYLRQILAVPDTDPREYLRRNRIVKKVRKKYGSDREGDSIRS